MKTALSTKTLAINKIYLATEGEGIHVGTPEVIVRLQGCGIGCRHCDTPAALAFQAANQSPEEVLAAVKQYPLSFLWEKLLAGILCGGMIFFLLR